VPPGVVTVTAAVVAPLGTVAVRKVSDTALNVAAAPPKETEVVPVNPCPKISTVLPTLATRWTDQRDERRGPDVQAVKHTAVSSDAGGVQASSAAQLCCTVKNAICMLHHRRVGVIASCEVKVIEGFECAGRRDPEESTAATGTIRAYHTSLAVRTVEISVSCLH
jgi:hypothetical protein